MNTRTPPSRASGPLRIAGWREWVSLPRLNLPAVKAKLDTGARTSCLHAYSVIPYRERGALRVRFFVHPLQGRTDLVAQCTAAVHDYRTVTDSGGHREKRYVIHTPVEFAHEQWNIEITLTDRDPMRFRMLLGRSALHGRMLVNPAAAFTGGRWGTACYPKK